MSAGSHHLSWQPSPPLASLEETQAKWSGGTLEDTVGLGYVATGWLHGPPRPVLETATWDLVSNAASQCTLYLQAQRDPDRR